jgi:hypothetical protein
MDFGIVERRLDGGRFFAVYSGEFGRRDRVILPTGRSSVILER